MTYKVFRESGGFGFRDGFSLVELMIVLLVLGIVAAAGLRFAHGVVVWQRLQAGSDLFVSLAERARSLAVSRNGSYEIRVHDNRKAFAVAPSESGSAPFWRTLPSGVEFTRVPRRPIKFFSRGTAAPAGTYVLALEKAEIEVVVAGSGRIRWGKPK